MVNVVEKQTHQIELSSVGKTSLPEGFRTSQAKDTVTLNRNTYSFFQFI